MGRTILTDVNGWIPLIDHLVQSHGITVAAVFGRVWRYSTMYTGVCKASMTTIADDLSLSRSTVALSISRLVTDGYLVNLSPDNNGRTNVYKVTEKVVIASRFDVEIKDDEPALNSDSPSSDGSKPVLISDRPVLNSDNPLSEINAGPALISDTNNKSLLKESLNKNASHYWELTKYQLSLDMPRSAFAKFIEPIVFISLVDDSMLLESPDEYSCKWFTSRMITSVERLLTGIFNRPIKLVITAKG